MLKGQYTSTAQSTAHSTTAPQRHSTGAALAGSCTPVQEAGEQGWGEGLLHGAAGGACAVVWHAPHSPMQHHAVLHVPAPSHLTQPGHHIHICSAEGAGRLVWQWVGETVGHGAVGGGGGGDGAVGGGGGGGGGAGPGRHSVWIILWILRERRECRQRQTLRQVCIRVR